MARKPKEYQRLPGRGARAGLAIYSRTSLWLGSDHLLAANWQGYSEEYKRFYYRDIQAVTLRRTYRASVISLVLLLVIIGISVLAAFVERESPGAWIGFSFPIGFFVLLLIANVVRGPSCRAQLRTAVHTEDLPSLNRVRVARKVLARLQPFLVAAQGEVTPAMIAAGLPAVPPALQSAIASTTKKVHHEKAFFHLLAFTLLVVLGLWVALDYNVTSVAVTLLSIPIGLAMTIATVIALVRQHGSDLPAALRGFTFAAAGFCGLMFVLSYVQLFVMLGLDSMALDSMAMQNQWQMLLRFSRAEPSENAFVMWVYIIEITLALLVGLPGLLLALRWRKPASGA